MKQIKLKIRFGNTIVLFALLGLTMGMTAQTKKPNILIIWGDDIGTTNVSAYSDGLMGYTTPNIDRVGNEGIRFLHYYAEQSCTAGRAALITGQHGIRTGLTKVGFPGAPMGNIHMETVNILTE
ncbi:sulfatase-like protein [Flavobacterium chryseum]|uniref:sulfatase-like hydrolase/transferase n=1 Tax=Flavobacterium sp. P3160 TaxID=2512113 RepID=UPI0010F33550|nr:sulfatase-like hydrolase/transferase [Flavobacterium sp. P3160]TDO83756.1 sulfatase-like protein [Flavobacterium sp. P3160]